MSQALTRLLHVLAALCALLGFGTAGSGAAQRPAGSAGSIDSCLVGTWRDGHEQESTIWEGQKVALAYRGGDVDHIYPSGLDRDDWQHSAAEHGSFHGHRLTQVIRGTLRLQLHMTGPHRFRVTAGTWSSDSSSHFRYRGHRSEGRLSPMRPFTVRYRCTADTLTFVDATGTVTGVERRISTAPS